MAVCHRSELRVYDHLGGGTPVTLPASDVKWSWVLGGGGYLSFTVDDRVEPLLSTPRLLDDCVVKVAVPLTEPGTSLTEVAAYAVRGRSGTLWGPNGGSSRRISGAPTLWTAWAQDAILHPESNEIAQMSLPERYFGWMSTIYSASQDAGLWATPGDQAGKQKSPSTKSREGNPDGWPTDLEDAYWITKPDGPMRGWRHLFIADCVVPSDCYLTVYFSGDESAAVYFGSSLVIQTSSSETGYESLSYWSAFVEAGTYRVAIDKTSIGSRGGDGIDPALLAVATNNNDGSVADVLLVTNAADWLCYTTDPDGGEVPSLTPGQIVEELHSQAVQRGVSTWSALTLGFDGDMDSDGVAWPNREERNWRIGYDRYLDMVEGLGDLGFAPEVTPALVLEAWADRGTDRSATVTLATLDEIATADEQGVGITATYLPVETQDGWTIVTSAAAEAAVGRREAALSLGNAPSTAQGKRLGQKVLDERMATAETERTINFYARTGSVPFQDFGLGDTVSITVGASTTKGVILDLAAAQSSVEGILRWTAKVSGDGISGEVRAGRFVGGQPAMAYAEGAAGSLTGDPSSGAAIFGTLVGTAAASGEVGSLVGVIAGGAAIFGTRVGTASATGAEGSFTGAAAFATAVGTATAEGASTTLAVYPGYDSSTVAYDGAVGYDS